MGSFILSDAHGYIQSPQSLLGNLTDLWKPDFEEILVWSVPCPGLEAELGVGCGLFSPGPVHLPAALLTLPSVESANYKGTTDVLSIRKPYPRE